MATETTSFNPYQAPSIPTSEASLAPDTEFLFNDKVVAGAGTIVLPRICVVSGSTDFLLVRQSRLWWCPRWITISRYVMIFAALFGGIPMLMNHPLGMRRVSSSMNFAAWAQLMIGAGLTLGAIAFVTAYYVVRSSIQVHWFISQRVAYRTFFVSIVNLMLSIGCTIGVMFWARHVGFGILVVPAIWVLRSVVQVIQGKRILYVADQKDGLFLIGGLSDKFLAETKRMSDEYTARTGSLAESG